MFKRLLFALGLCLISSAAWAQNVTCATRPAGDSTNACASTAFVQSATSGGIPATTNVLKGSGTAGSAVAAIPGTDYVVPTNIANNDLLANISGSSALPTGTTPSGFFDSVCSTTVGQFWVRMTGGWGCTSLGYANPVWWGADPTGASDSSTAFTDAYNAVSTNGGEIRPPTGTYKLASLPTITANHVSLICRAGTILEQNATTSHFLVMNGQYDREYGCEFQPLVRITGGYYQIYLNSNCYFCEADKTLIQYADDGIQDLGTESRITDLVELNLLGTSGINFTGTSTTGAYGLTVDRMTANNPYPNPYGTVVSWSTSLAVTANEIIFANNNIYQCTTSGTTASTGSGPSGLPSGTTPQSAFSNTITDGTAQWKFVSGTLYWIANDNYAYSMRLNKVGLINGAEGVSIQDSAGTGSSYPSYLFVDDVEIDHPYSTGLSIIAGLDDQITNSYIGSSLSGPGVNIAGTFKGELSLTNSRVFGNWQNGIVLAAGTKIVITNDQIVTNAVAGINAYDGVNIAAGLTNFNVSNNFVGQDSSLTGTSNQYDGVAVNTGASDYYVMLGDICDGGNTAGCVVDSGTGSNKSVGDNW